MTNWSLEVSLAAFCLGALAVGLGGPRLVKLADSLAEQTGLGEAFFGAVFLGAATSVSGVLASVTAAADGHPVIAYTNAVGGIAIQTLFLVAADLAYRRTNLEYAAASLSNMMFVALLIVLLLVALGAAFTPSATLIGIHPATLVLFIGYLAGLRTVRVARQRPGWSARPATASSEDREPTGGSRGSLAPAFAQIGLIGIAVAAAGSAIALGGVGIARNTGLSEGFVGVVLTGVATSLPELVTTISAVRSAALVMAVGGIVGGNAFDVLFLGFADIAYRDGSLFHAVDNEELLVMAAALLMSAVLLMGLLARQERGPGNIGNEAWLLAAIYAGMVALVAIG